METLDAEGNLQLRFLLRLLDSPEKMKLLSLIILVLLPFSGGAAVTDLKSAEEYVNASARFPAEGLW